MQSPKRRKSTKTTKKRQTSKEDAFRLKAEPLLEALDSAIFQRKAIEFACGLLQTKKNAEETIGN